MTQKSLNVAVPWSLSHYISLNGFHPLYRALFDYAPAGLVLNAWDNVRLYKYLNSDTSVRSGLLHAAKHLKGKTSYKSGNQVEKGRQDYFWPPNQILTAQLPGEIEFHHTAPFPSLTRPFIFHCESFAPIFFPLAQQGAGLFANPDQVREHYRGILANPLCLGIFSYIPETLASIRKFFGDDEIDKKLFPSDIGLSRRFLDPEDIEARGDLSAAKFLFINSAHQNPESFFKRGGHIALRFWERYRGAGRQGLLVIRCIRPGDAEFEKHGVNPAFVAAETGESILWVEDYLTDQEMNALLEEMHFLLLPSNSLHSMSIMQAMADGVIPVVTDTIGTSRYVTDTENGIVLKGMREALWRLDPATGVLIDQYYEKPEIDALLIDQLWSRVSSLLDDPATYYEMRNKAFRHARVNFSGTTFSAGFWRKVSELYEGWELRSVGLADAAPKIGEQLQDALIRANGIGANGWGRVFGSPTQPLRRVCTGRSIIHECCGAFIVVFGGNPNMRLTDWSMLASHFDKDAPEVVFGSAITDFDNRFLLTDGHESKAYLYIHGLVEYVFRVFAPFPALHGFVVGILYRVHRYRRMLSHYLRVPQV